MHRNRPAKHACFLLILALTLCATLVAQSVPQTFAEGPYLLRLPLVAKSEPPGALPTPQPGTPPEQLALDRINAYRALAGVPPVEPHAALLAAAQHHADYDLLNHSDPAAWAYGPHGEVSGKPGFSGAMPGDRAVAAGYPWAAGWEVMGYFDDPLRAVGGVALEVWHC
jgi:Cysteine-rich secretory protein family